MNLLLTFALSTLLAARASGSARPIAAEPDSAAVDRVPVLSREDALAVLMSEHRLSLPIYFIQTDSKYPSMQAAISR